MLDAVVASDEAELARAAAGERYARALGLALLFPETARCQKRLAEVRTPRVVLPEVPEREARR
jgi:hypothetical protein